MAMWVKPSADTVLLPESNSGVKGLHDKRNDVFAATHGDSFAQGGNHAGSGIAIGRNGVAVFEHGAGYFVPILVHAAPVADWTHVAVVYRDGEPSLYLNGKFVRKGLKSSKTVHSSVTSAGADAKFSGKVSRVESLPRALDEADLAKLMGSAPGDAPGFDGLSIELTFNESDRIEVVTRVPGSYAVKSADGGVKKLEVVSVPAPVEIRGSWEMSFKKNTGERSHNSELKVDFDRLVSWTERPEEWIKYYGGTATYRKTFGFPVMTDAKSQISNENLQSEISNLKSPQAKRLWLDLGEVHDMACVRVNGQDAGIVWKQPYRLDITKLVKKGENHLEIEVVNTWLNRLIGDEQPEAKKSTFAIMKSWKASTTLLPAGLLGPVTVIEECVGYAGSP